MIAFYPWELTTPALYPWKRSERTVIIGGQSRLYRICFHGTRHESLGSVHYRARCATSLSDLPVCACVCRCCQQPDWRLADAELSVKTANHILWALREKFRGFNESALRLRREHTRLCNAVRTLISPSGSLNFANIWKPLAALFHKKPRVILP